MTTDAERFEWLASWKANQIYVERDVDHATNYQTAAEWLDSGYHDDFKYVTPERIAEMKRTNTIWRVQIYPDTPIGSHIWYGPTLRDVIDQAMAECPEPSR